MAARLAGGTPRNFRSWRKDDEDFAADWDDAEEEGTDHLEDVATERAEKKSDALMAMMLKARRPDRFDRGSKLELSGGISVEGSKSTLLNKLARLKNSVPQEIEVEGKKIPEEDDEQRALLPPPRSRDERSKQEDNPGER